MEIKESGISDIEIFGLEEFLSEYLKDYSSSKKEKILENYDYFLEEASKKFFQNSGEKFKEQMKFFIKNAEIEEMGSSPLYYMPLNPTSSEINHSEISDFLFKFDKMLSYIPLRAMKFLKEKQFPYGKELSDLFDDYLWENSRETFNIQNLGYKGKIGKWIKDSRLSNTLAVGVLMRKAEREGYWDLECGDYKEGEGYENWKPKGGQIKIAGCEKGEEASITVLYADPFCSGVKYEGDSKECLRTKRRFHSKGKDFEEAYNKTLSVLFPTLADNLGN